MNCCLIAVNSRYIHTSPAVDSLQAFSEQSRKRKAGLPQREAVFSGRGLLTERCSFTINQPAGQILGELYRKQAGAYFFSVYIWNCELIYRLSRELRQILPEAEIWYGGPEVSFRSAELLRAHPEVRGILRGEGEETFAELAETVYGGEKPALSELPGIAGITYRLSVSEEPGKKSPLRGEEEPGEEDPPACRAAACAEKQTEGGEPGTEKILENLSRLPMEPDRLVFPYEGTEADPNRIYYYESSRGCPFSCSYCLSSVDKALRFKSLEKVKTELVWFLENGVKQVKFVDRTFNLPGAPAGPGADGERAGAGTAESRALAIWRFLKERDNGFTNFHFEICAELLTEEELDFLSTLRPGQVQFEIGVQTTDPAALATIRRQRDEEKLKRTVSRLLAGKNIHIHLDLIAGLPFEDLAGFRKSFNTVYAMHPLQLQLGFLKILKGTPMESFAAEYGFRCQALPPFEVLSTPWLSFGDLLELKGVEEMTEVYYNSRQFERTMAALEEEAFPGGAYGIYERLSVFYRGRGYDRMDHSRMDRYRILMEFIAEDQGLDREKYCRLLLADALARERLKRWPDWAGKREKPVLYDYDRRDPLTGNALPEAGNTAL